LLPDHRRPTTDPPALCHPTVFLGIFASFSGVLVPYAQITAFWRYWLYYLNPWTYILGAETFFAMRNIPVECADDEYARFPPPNGQTCEAYMAPYVAQAPGYLLDPSSTTECAYCQVRLKPAQLLLLAS
jgi:ATP-binding cassette subfamily G (WHITE) protein 2 (SNQ2)